jgi:hypothetical protein
MTAAYLLKIEQLVYINASMSFAGLYCCSLMPEFRGILCLAAMLMPC